jgi:hypothetical protein
VTIEDEYDAFGVPLNPAERMQQAMLGFFDLKDELEAGGFSPELQIEYERLRLRFVEAFEQAYPGYGKGRAVWR